MFDLQDLAYLSRAGFTLNEEEKTVLKSSMEIKLVEEKLKDMALWGKILGIQKDYYIAQGWQGDDMFQRKYYYSLDMVNWLQLANVSYNELVLINTIHGRFYGDPAYEYPLGKEKGLQRATSYLLHKRLAGVVALISHESEIVPRGAYFRDASHNLKVNPSFLGLDCADLPDLGSYFHFRPGFNVNTKSFLERANRFDLSIDVLEPISKDEPRGAWAVQTEDGAKVAVLRSVLWPGYSFFHSLKPAKWGGFYFGTGQRNVSLGYML
ncbi:hypothetical protein BJ742DRAFT_716394 [Cladochytrium replicatum]|nr:hypothetical protein BJ742DRAFT_716394 [Cladochytrium replicatum]